MVLERARVGQSWRTRWDSFCLVTPNWTVQLPGHPYEGDDPDGYLPRDDLVAYVEGYAGRFDAPVRGGVDVTGIVSHTDEGFFVLSFRGVGASLGHVTS